MKKSLWKKRIQKYNHYEFSTQHYVEEKYKEKGTCVIQLDLPDFNSFIEPYSIHQPILKKELGEYIERVCYDIPTYYPISIQLYDYYTEKEKETIKSLIRSYFGLKVGDIAIDLKNNSIKSLILFLTGILILIFCVFFSYEKVNSVFLEIMSIAGWFAIWEFVDAIWLNRSKMQMEKTNAGQLASAQIKFIPKEKGQL